MGQWKNKINLIKTEGRGNYDPMIDQDAWDLLFCFSQLDEKSDDWSVLTEKANEFMGKGGNVRQDNAERITKLLNNWATGKNSPLHDLDNSMALRFSAPSYLFRGFEKLRQYFTSMGVDLEANMPQLKPETKQCMQTVNAKKTEPLSVPEDMKKVNDLRSYIADGYDYAFSYGMNPHSEQKKQRMDPYQNGDQSVQKALTSLDESLRAQIGMIYETIKDSKKWYGKDSEEFTRMVAALQDYMDVCKEDKEAGQEVSERKREKLEKAMQECSQYLEKNDGVKFTSVGAKRRDAVRQILERMNQLPEVQKAPETQKRANVQQKKKEGAEKVAANPEVEKVAAKPILRKAAAKPVAEVPKRGMEAQTGSRKNVGPIKRDEEWFKMVDAVVKMAKKTGDIQDNNFRRFATLMNQYKKLTKEDQERVQDIWVNKNELGEESWKALKKAYGIKRVTFNFEGLKEMEEKENPKKRDRVRRERTEPKKEVLQEKAKNM